MFIDGAWTTPGDDRLFDEHQPGDWQAARRRCRRPARPMSTPRWPPRAAPSRAGRSCPAIARARYLYAMARQVQKHSRLLAVLETMDNGKPIRETRDIDIPLVARHFYHHAGWAQLHATASCRATAPVGVVGQIIPWNFPLLMLAWKIAPALADGQHGRAQAGRVHAAHRAAVRRDLRRGRAAAGRGQHRHRRRRDRRS